MTQQYIDELVAAYPSITEVWLFGSRANGTERTDSDWDYMVFGDDPRLLNSLHMDTRFDVTGIDLFFVAAPNIAAQPWADERQKVLNLNDEHENMAWSVLSRTEASYRATKEFDPPRFAVDLQIKKAVLRYRR